MKDEDGVMTMWGCGHEWYVFPNAYEDVTLDDLKEQAMDRTCFPCFRDAMEKELIRQRIGETYKQSLD